MTTRTPIDPSEIRKGDLIRYERGAGYAPNDRAHEYVAAEDGDTAGYGHNCYFLLDRPKPPVELPTEPKLGWVEHAEIKRQFGAWIKSGDTLHAMRQSDFDPASVTAFTPATAVPTEALEALRDDSSKTDVGYLRAALRIFFDSVDEANRVDS